MNYKIVDAEEKHIEQLAGIDRACFSMPWSMDFLRAQMKNNNHEFLAATDEDGTVLGYAGMMYVLDEGYISNVAVREENRRSGIADSLLDALTVLANSHGLAFITLELRESNSAAAALYSKHGFEPAGRRKNYYDFPKEDAILMTLYLNRG